MPAYLSIHYTVPNTNGVVGKDGKPRRERRTACYQARDAEHQKVIDAEYRAFLKRSNYDVELGETVHVQGVL